MADIANAAILASLVVGMVSIPAASGTINSNSTVPEPVDNISSTQDVPVQESTELTADSFTRQVETAFSSFTTSVNSGQVDGELETPQSRLEAERSAGETVWKIETSEGSMKVVQSSGKIKETTETPYGTLEEVNRNGAVQTSFTGSNREKVEQVSGDLRDLMEEKKQKYREKTSNMRTERYSEGISLDVHEESPEKVTITNEMSRTVNMEGWKISNDNPDFFELNSSLAAGQELNLYSAGNDDDALENVTENSDDLYVYNSDLTWANGGDTATLYDSQGNEVGKHSY